MHSAAPDSRETLRQGHHPLESVGEKDQEIIYSAQAKHKQGTKWELTGRSDKSMWSGDRSDGNFTVRSGIRAQF